ncbi:MAG: flagellar filament capping protein FliD [Treponema sp.]|jgi:flagellar hook-associated protein 2|nr:flagellar filament capping protein FliD [Treponema sp.]
MSDIYVPGVKSRFGTDELVENLMKIERLPKDRSEKNIEGLQTQKTYWQEVGRRITTLRDSARFLYSYQNPFNDRMVNSSHPGVLTGTSTRDADDQEHYFTVKQIAQADRFLSDPLASTFRAEAGTYTFSVGENRVSFNFRGGSLQEFSEALNRRGRDKIRASLITVQPGKKSLLIESRITGTENHLKFSDEALELALRAGIVEAGEGDTGDPSSFIIQEAPISVRSGDTAQLPFNDIPQSPEAILRFEIATALSGEPAPEQPTASMDSAVEEVLDEAEASQEEEAALDTTMSEDDTEQTDGIVIMSEDISPTDETEAPAVLAEDYAPQPTIPRVDNMNVLFLRFTDGTSTALPPIEDSESFQAYQYPFADIADETKTIASLELVNLNTHRAVSIGNVTVTKPGEPEQEPDNVVPRNPISEAQDALLTMEGIDITRPSNTIDDLLTGVTLTVKAPSDALVHVQVEPNRESIKDSIITMVANYNRLVADINVLTRRDETVINELTYLSDDERAELRKRMGVFAGDAILAQFKTSLQRAATAPYPTSAERDLALLAQIGISTNARGSTGAGYDPTRLRGYLEIDENVLNAAMDKDLHAVQQLFGSDTDGDLIVDSGIAYMFESLGRPYTEIGGIISLKTNTIDARVSQQQRRIDTLDRQLASKEAALKLQYGQMENAYNRMEQMTSSLDQFSQQNSNNR